MACNLGHRGSTFPKAHEDLGRINIPQLRKITPFCKSHVHLQAQISISHLLVFRSFNLGEVFTLNSGSDGNEHMGMLIIVLVVYDDAGLHARMDRRDGGPRRRSRSRRGCITLICAGILSVLARFGILAGSCRRLRRALGASVVVGARHLAAAHDQPDRQAQLEALGDHRRHLHHHSRRTQHRPDDLLFVGLVSLQPSSLRAHHHRLIKLHPLEVQRPRRSASQRHSQPPPPPAPPPRGVRTCWKWSRESDASPACSCPT